MVQGYAQQDCGSKGGWSSGLLSKRSEGRNSFAGAIHDRGEELLCSYPCGVANDQRIAYFPEEPKLSGVEATDREVGGPMLNVTGLNRFYCLCDFTDMRCKRSRVLSIIREQLHREPDDGDVFIVMFDGTSSSLPDDSVANKKTEAPAAAAPKEKKPRDLSNHPDTYKTMGVQGTSKEYKSDLSKVPGRVLEKKMLPVFHLDVSIVEERFELVHYVEKGKKPKWGYFPVVGNPQIVTKFDGTKVTPEFLQAIAYEVYVKNVTFGLLHRWLTDLGMQVSANTLRNWLKKGKKYLDELVKVLKEVALEKDSIVNCDETWCKVRKYDHYKKCYIWVLVNKAEQTVIFFYEDGSRGRDVLTNFIGDAELKSVMTDGYNAYVFIGDELSTVQKSPNLKKAIHQVCMAHLKAKLDKALEQAGDVRALPFLRGVDFFYGREHQYDKEGLSPEERGKRRQDLESKEMLITLRQHLKIELDKAPSETTPYLRAALKYLDKFWDNIFAFLKDGSLPIDNNLAERAIRPLTTQRNAMLHFGSDEGVEMAATYHSIISAVKMQGRSAWEYLGKFFTKIFNGCRDFFSMRPDKIGLAICQ